MTTPVYPDDLPGVSDYQFTPTPQLVVTDTERSARATHRFSQVPGALATASWNFKRDEYLKFMNWWREELLDGHRWFKIKLPSAAGLQYTIVRFIEHRTTENRGYKYWTVNASLELLERRIRPQVIEQYLTTTLYPILDTALLQSKFDIVTAQMSPPVPIPETLQPQMTILGGILEDLVKFGYSTDWVAPQMTLLSGSLRDVMNSTSIDPESIGPAFTVVSAMMNRILITNEIPPEGLSPSFSILSGSLT